MVNFSLILINFHSLFSLIKFSNSICITTVDPIVEIYRITDLVYILFSDRVGWMEARSICQYYDAELAVPDTRSKTTALAYFIKMSNFQFGQFWIGGSYKNNQWLWSDVQVIQNINFTTFDNNQLNFTNKCLVIKRQFYLKAIFAEQMCSLPKPFICERSILTGTRKQSLPTFPVQSTKINSSVFTIYHSEVSWFEAFAFCRSLDQRLAIVSDKFTINALNGALLRSRPSMENAWIGGYCYNYEWIWLATGTKMLLDSDLPLIPYNNLKFKEACLLFDRHLNRQLFIPSRCKNKKNFICEKFDETHDIRYSQISKTQCFAGDTEFTIYLTKKTWVEAQIFCQSKNSILAEPGEEKLVKELTECLKNSDFEQKHFWLGGIKNRAKWIWINSLKYVNTSLCCFTDDLFELNEECLNLDKSTSNEPLMYGIKCTNEQAFVCQKSKDKPSKCVCPCNRRSISVFYNDQTYLALLDSIIYNRVDYYCERFGGKLIDSALPQHIRNYVFSYIQTSLISCCCPLDKINVWLKNQSENSCTTGNLKSLEINTNENCTVKNAYICQIDNCIPPKIDLNSTTNCKLTKMENGNSYNSCTFGCNVGFSHFGPSKFICDAYGWSTRTEMNETTPFLYPECVEISQAHQGFLYIIEHIKFDGYYFIIKEQTNWDKIRDFVMSFVKIFRVSKDSSMGLLTFGKFVEVKIPYNSSNNCEVLTQIYNIKSNAKNNNDANYNLAFNEIQNQINRYQPGKRTLIIFIADSKNTGESYIKTLHQLKQTHLIYVFGITEEVIDDFDIVAGIEINHRLHAIKVRNHDELEIITQGLNKDKRSSIYC